jgi:hypothetical protein
MYTPIELKNIFLFGWKHGKIYTKSNVSNKILGSLNKKITKQMMRTIIYFFCMLFLNLICMDFKSKIIIIIF